MTPAFPTSLPEFMRTFPEEASCAAYLEKIRWPDGFVCPYDGAIGEPYRISTRPWVLQCRTCRRQTSLIVGTVMERTHSPLSTWFWGAYLVASQTPGQSALQFQRQLGLSRYETAFQMLHKLRAGLVRPDRDRIGAEYPVEVDEAYIGGRTRGEGRGKHHKAIVVGAVEIRVGKDKEPKKHGPEHEAGVPVPGRMYAGRLRLRVVPDRKTHSLETFLTENVKPNTIVVTDGWQGYDGLDKLGYYHDPQVLRGDPEKAEAFLPLIHIVFSNLKTWIQGTHHGVSQQHLQAYLNEYVFRFNRRFYPFNAFNSVLGIASHVHAPTYDALYGGGGATRTGKRGAS